MNIVILVPRRSDGGHRDRLWKFCEARWAHQFPDHPIIVGASPPGPFNRSAALNHAAAQAPDADMFLLIDADVLANPDTVRTAVEIAHATGRIVLPYTERIHLNNAGTEKVIAGYDGPWRVRQMVQTIYTKQDSCVVAVPRSTWDAVGGFDELFVDWFGEDTAFNIAAETLTGKSLVRIDGEVFHLHHPPADGTAKTSTTRIANAARLDRYLAAAGDVDAIRALLEESFYKALLAPTRIPRILHRTVPEHTTDEIEAWWTEFRRLHPGWELRTYRDPIDPKDWPLTGDLFRRCANGAQKAGLIRLECLVRDGGIYVDSDVRPFRSLEPLLHCSAFAGWEDDRCIPDAVLGAEPDHPAFVTALDKARSVIEGGGDAWHSGPGVTTEVLQNRPDVLLLPPGSFYDVHYLDKANLDRPANPWEFARHMWHGSWLSPAQRKSQQQRQRT
jgi:hypothetical protein